TDTHPDRAPRLFELREPLRRRAALDRFCARERPDEPEQVGDAFDVSRFSLRGKELQLVLDFVDRVGIENLAQLGLPEQLAQERGVEGQRLRPTLGKGRVALVQKRCYVTEKQRPREG